MLFSVEREFVSLASTLFAPNSDQRKQARLEMPKATATTPLSCLFAINKPTGHVSMQLYFALNQRLRHAS